MLPFKLIYHPGFEVDLGPHVLPAQKYRLVHERLLAEGLAERSDFLTPGPADDADVLRVHTSGYVAKAKSGRLTPGEQRALELPWSEGLVRASWLSAGACILAGRRARQDRAALVLGGGLHHAFPDHGEGFCLIHDVAVAVACLRAGGEVRRVAILDLDVHQGNGTATILGGEADVFTVSIHQEQNYPVPKPPSHLDVGLPDGTTDAEYLRALEGPLARCVGFAPDILFYLAGADPFEHDRLGGLALSKAGLAERDRRVFQAAADAGLPVAVTLAGGYAESPADTVAIHVNTVRAAADVFAGRDRR